MGKVRNVESTPVHFYFCTCCGAAVVVGVIIFIQFFCLQQHHQHQHCCALVFSLKIFFLAVFCWVGILGGGIGSVYSLSIYYLTVSRLNWLTHVISCIWDLLLRKLTSLSFALTKLLFFIFIFFFWLLGSFFYWIWNGKTYGKLVVNTAEYTADKGAQW